MDKAMPLLRGEEGEVVGGQSGKKSSEKRTGKKSRERRTGKKSRKKNREKELEKKSREKEPERSIGKNKKSLKSKKETRDA
ncbi:hypothetical protein [Bacteroides eggerthii]|uniref:hypothetical protein n=2 Tax=Bacteroides eggerthii TaxID=28111 RepID=UPI000AAB308B|nr:hypothetical protein [Bacteroides eggerthii]